jgi:DNA-binding CsgD family transcriptional regulator
MTAEISTTTSNVVAFDGLNADSLAARGAFRSPGPELVLAHFLRGQDRAAEAAARLAVESGTSLTQVYETLRTGVYTHPRPLTDAETLERREIDERISRLATRLQPAPNRVGEPQAMALTTLRRGVGACINHLFTDRGVTTLSIDLDTVARLRRGGSGVNRLMPGLQYILIDGAESTAAELLAHAAVLQHLHLAGERYVVAILGDDADAVAAADLNCPDDVFFVSSLADLLVAAGLPPTNPLTPREHAVLEFVADGATNQHIANALGISLATVKTYLERSQAKLKSCDRASTVANALRRGWL